MQKTFKKNTVKRFAILMESLKTPNDMVWMKTETYVRVHDSLKNDSLDSNSVEKQRTFYSMKSSILGSITYKDRDTQVSSKPLFKAHYGKSREG